MFSMRYCVQIGLVLALSTVGSRASCEELTGPVAAPAASGLVRIGLSRSLFSEVPEALVTSAARPFGALMESQTGLRGDLGTICLSSELASQLERGQLHLAVFPGIEFAWARQKHPGLSPLMIAVNDHTYLRAHLMVRRDGPAREFANLERQTLARSRGCKVHCRLFLDRLCGRDHDSFFGKITTPQSAEESLDDVVDGIATATVVDDQALACYQRRKPGRFARLSELSMSERFPTAVVVYRPGVLAEPTLNQFRERMLAARHNEQARRLLTLWKITGFEAVPADYEQVLAEVARAYPGTAQTVMTQKEGSR